MKQIFKFNIDKIVKNNEFIINIYCAKHQTALYNKYRKMFKETYEIDKADCGTVIIYIRTNN